MHEPFGKALCWCILKYIILFMYVDEHSIAKTWLREEKTKMYNREHKFIFLLILD